MQGAPPLRVMACENGLINSIMASGGVQLLNGCVTSRRSSLAWNYLRHWG
jgi:hypothetical protein